MFKQIKNSVTNISGGNKILATFVETDEIVSPTAV